MATASGRPSGRTRLSEEARRAQLVEVTVALVADVGYGGASLARIAERAGITKAAVLYHYASKEAVIAAAFDQVLAALTADVGAAVDAADPVAAPSAYVRTMVGHLRTNPSHTRMIIEAMTAGGGSYAPAERWGPVADLISAARGAAGRPDDLDARTLAIVVGGGIDGIVAEQLADPDYDTAAAAEVLVEVLERALAA